jgi:hypothetical protein
MHQDILFAEEAKKMLKRIIYNSQHDILSIDTNIKKKFENEKQELDKFKDLVENIENILINLPDNTELKNIRDELINRIHDIENQESFSYYLIKSFDILNDYKQNFSGPVKIQFFSKKNETPKQNKNQTYFARRRPAFWIIAIIAFLRKI